MKPINHVFYWEYPAGTIPDELIAQTQAVVQKQTRIEGQIGDGSVDKKIRSVERTPLDEFEAISVFLFGLAVKANNALFRFDLGGPSQFEMLHYTKKGDHYDCHADTQMYDNGFSRKLSVMGYFNDDYKGGRFYFKVFADERHYVDIKKGTVLVFPPYIQHGVEPVEDGVREGVVGWITGPNFR